MGEFELFDLREIAIFNIHVSCGISPICQGFQNTVCACLIAKESSRLRWLLIALKFTWTFLKARMNEYRIKIILTISHCFFINVKPWLSLGFAQFIFSVTLPCVIFISTPPIIFPMVRQSFMLNPGCCLRFQWSHVLLNRRPTAPVYRQFVKSTAPGDNTPLKVR